MLREALQLYSVMVCFLFQNGKNCEGKSGAVSL